MIIKASQRGGGRQLADHLLNARDNEHVSVHEVSGFMSETVHGALNEAYALSKGTQCQKYLFSVSLNPPEGENVNTPTFQEATNRIEASLGLEGQPRVMVFHEKEGRRHAHVTWSRIDGQEMKALRQDYYKNRLMDIAKELYLENGWKMPQGFIDKELRNPLNFDLAEWQQAKRQGTDPRMIKAGLQQCWQQSDSKTAFQNALKERGYQLAKGDRRGYVAVDYQGEVYSLSKWTGVKTKALKERLGDHEKLPSVQETKANIDRALKRRTDEFIRKSNQYYKRKLAPLLRRKTHMQARHSTMREALYQKQEERNQSETRERQDRLHTGVRGLWQRLTGKHKAIVRQNEVEANQSYNRDQIEQDKLTQQQLNERQPLQQSIRQIEKQHKQDIAQIKESVYSPKAAEITQQLKSQFQEQAVVRQEHTPSMNM